MFSSSSALVIKRAHTLRLRPIYRHLPRSRTWATMNPVAVPLYLTDGGGCLGRRVRIAAQIAELDENLVRTRVRQGVEDGRGLEEHGAGLVGLALAQQYVAEPGQRVALAEQGTDLAVGVDGLPVVGPGLGQVTQVQVDEDQAVQGVGRAAAVARFPVQAQRPLAVLERVVVLAEVGVQPADAVLQRGL